MYNLGMVAMIESEEKYIPFFDYNLMGDEERSYIYIEPMF